MSRQVRKDKSLEKVESGLRDLQASEIAQNRQRNLWKSLEKKGPDLRKLAKKLAGAAALAALCDSQPRLVRIPGRQQSLGLRFETRVEKKPRGRVAPGRNRSVIGERELREIGEHGGAGRAPP